MYKVLLFDIDGTLLDFDHDMEIAFRHMYTVSGLENAKPLTRELMEIYEVGNLRWWRRFEQGLCEKTELYNRRFEDFFEAAGLPYVDPNLLNSIYFDALGQSGTFYPGAEAMLAALAEKYPIYIITNGNAPSQKTRMALSGLNRYIQGYFISEAIGAAKPDKRYFDYVLAHIPGARAQDCIVIGDSLTSDMRGAVNAGMDSIWFNPKHLENTIAVPVTYEAADFDDILHILL
ncbi:MAG: YjjG family noncanonical pyrimidine nucleotidase [Clostridia bacterium]|nr:YjjG family noncanonical pyrimidine nucleotidase [Clostridia bacterium]